RFARAAMAQRRMPYRENGKLFLDKPLDKVLTNFTLLGGGLGRRIRPKPPALGRCGGARVPSGCPLRTSPTVKLIAARRNLVLRGDPNMVIRRGASREAQDEKPYHPTNDRALGRAAAELAISDPIRQSRRRALQRAYICLQRVRCRRSYSRINPG